MHAHQCQYTVELTHNNVIGAVAHFSESFTQ